jgi:hypothetical protein
MKSDQSDADDLIVLTRVAPELAPLLDDEPPKYRFLANKLANAAVPAGLVEYIRGHYYVRRSNLPAFGQALGLRLKPPVPGTCPPAAKPARSRSTRPAA